MNTHTTLRATLLALITLFIAPQAHAQNILFKVGGGIATTYSSHLPVSSYMAGAGYEYEFSERWGVTPGLFLQAKGWKDHDVDVVYLDDPIDGDPINGFREGQMSRKTSTTGITLAVPFNHYIRCRAGNYLILSAGPFATYGLSARTDIKGDPSRTEGERIGYSVKGHDALHLRRLDAGVMAQVAFQFGNGLTLGVQADFSALSPWKSTAAPQLSAAAQRQVSGMVTLSYNFHQGESYRNRIVERMWNNSYIMDR